MDDLSPVGTSTASGYSISGAAAAVVSATAVVQWSRIVAEVIYICMSSMRRCILSIVFGKSILGDNGRIKVVNVSICAVSCLGKYITRGLDGA